MRSFGFVLGSLFSFCIWGVLGSVCFGYCFRTEFLVKDAVVFVEVVSWYVGDLSDRYRPGVYDASDFA